MLKRNNRLKLMASKKREKGATQSFGQVSCAVGKMEGLPKSQASKFEFTTPSSKSSERFEQQKDGFLDEQSGALPLFRGKMFFFLQDCFFLPKKSEECPKPVGEVIICEKYRHFGMKDLDKTWPGVGTGHPP